MPKTIAIMQPYLLPYIGYFQLANYVDEFWLFDTAQYTKKGWINRNVIADKSNKLPFLLPVKKGRQKDLIKDKTIVPDDALFRIRKFIKSFELAYNDAPFRNVASFILNDLHEGISREEGPLTLVDVIERSLQLVFTIMGIKSVIRRTSSITYDQPESAGEHILRICQSIQATHYVNMINGKELYDCKSFQDHGISLTFLVPMTRAYSNHSGIYTLSVLDLLSYVSQSNYQLYLQPKETVPC